MCTIYSLTETIQFVERNSRPIIEIQNMFAEWMVVWYLSLFTTSRKERVIMDLTGGEYGFTCVSSGYAMAGGQMYCFGVQAK